jgi:hypothetical protein
MNLVQEYDRWRERVQIPVRGRDLVRLQFLETIRAIRRCLRPFALHYLLVGRKRWEAR